MEKYVIVTDSCSDLPRETVEASGLDYVSLIGRTTEGEYRDDFGLSLPHKQFYAKLAEGEMISTSQPSTHDFYELFVKYAREHIPVLYIGVSSGLSGTYGGAGVARQMILEDYPDACLILVDTKTASLGQGMLVLEALALQENDCSLVEVAAYVEAQAARMKTYMTVDDLGHLVRGGRLTRLQAAIGGLLNVKPLLRLNEEGRVEVIQKVRGKKKALAFLADRIAEEIGLDAAEQTIAIAHGDSLEDALEIKRLILERTAVKDVLLHFVGPVVGVYGGVGAQAVFFRS